MTRTTLTFAAAALACTAGIAGAQTMTTTTTTTTTQNVAVVEPTFDPLSLSCLASAEDRFGTNAATVIDRTPIPGGVQFTLDVPGQDEPYVCEALNGESYLQRGN
ncbi:hypothetical protein [Roseivivax isoporae]|uniref:Uncharacterized protein n=1 Tax=Roseivivax isoporae LMG 25204 TaxID=1449351 RepID=X7F6R7_9RHOB|nr:hypothetical protein [Roseivivax isoporae]ETX27774.1 hypothetical protein RISW2_11275 [Roseivivax isoporae LMG 25204]